MTEFDLVRAKFEHLSIVTVRSDKRAQHGFCRWLVGLDDFVEYVWQGDIRFRYEE